MSLANFLLRTALGNDRAPQTLEIALYDGPVEVKDQGYRRVSVSKGSWRIQNERAGTMATFGPFLETARFDRSVVFQGSTIVDEKILPGGQRGVARTDVVRLEIELDLRARD